MTILLIIAKVDIIMGTDQYSILLGAYQITVQFQFMRHSQQYPYDNYAAQPMVIPCGMYQSRYAVPVLQLEERKGSGMNLFGVKCERMVGHKAGAGETGGMQDSI